MRSKNEVIKALQVYHLILTQINPDAKNLYRPFSKEHKKELQKERINIKRIINILEWFQGQNNDFEELLQAWIYIKNWQ